MWWRRRQRFLDTLSDAIQGFGIWTRWEDHPDRFALQFHGCDLCFPPQASQEHPSHAVAVVALQPTAVAFLSSPDRAGTGWVEALRSGECEDLQVDEIRFGDRRAARALLESFHEVRVHLGDPSRLPRRHVLSLSADRGSVGAVVGCEEIALLSSRGRVHPAEIMSAHQAFWSYYDEYQRLRRTDAPLAYDPYIHFQLPASDDASGVDSRSRGPRSA